MTSTWSLTARLNITKSLHSFGLELIGTVYHLTVNTVFTAKQLVAKAVGWSWGLGTLCDHLPFAIHLTLEGNSTTTHQLLLSFTEDGSDRTAPGKTPGQTPTLLCCVFQSTWKIFEYSSFMQSCHTQGTHIGVLVILAMVSKTVRIKHF